MNETSNIGVDSSSEKSVEQVKDLARSHNETDFAMLELNIRKCEANMCKPPTGADVKRRFSVRYRKKSEEPVVTKKVRPRK